MNFRLDEWVWVRCDVYCDCINERKNLLSKSQECWSRVHREWISPNESFQTNSCVVSDMQMPTTFLSRKRYSTHNLPNYILPFMFDKTSVSAYSCLKREYIWSKLDELNSELQVFDGRNTWARLTTLCIEFFKWRIQNYWWVFLIHSRALNWMMFICRWWKDIKYLNYWMWKGQITTNQWSDLKSPEGFLEKRIRGKGHRN